MLPFPIKFVKLCHALVLYAVLVGLVRAKPALLKHTPRYIYPVRISAQTTNTPKYLGSDITLPDHACLSAIDQVSKQIPALGQCYSMTGSLYFSNLNTVCSDGCMNMSIRGARMLAQECSASADINTFKPLHAYAAWGNETLAAWACENKPEDTYHHCLLALSDATTQLLNYEYGGTGSRDQLKAKLCASSCLANWVSLVADNPLRTPTVYYSDVVNIVDLHSKLSDLCGVV
ncbi:hypothetical protein EV182_001139 [Spiromyces aspiralis]|uniref:Uncharacterized protein n=1 Tax=Spiromyces aspiralis TaxID=68401 RepID=A0ACC1HUC5_9FUNG|nr:hypothetical protein EV182_001139 [Spiromyces aspiralis]